MQAQERFRHTHRRFQHAPRRLESFLGTSQAVLGTSPGVLETSSGAWWTLLSVSMTLQRVSATAESGPGTLQGDVRDIPGTTERSGSVSEVQKYRFSWALAVGSVAIARSCGCCAKHGFFRSDRGSERPGCVRERAGSVPRASRSVPGAFQERRERPGAF